MHNPPVSRPSEPASRMLAWGRILLVGGAALAILAWGAHLAGSPRMSPAALRLMLWTGAGGVAAGALLTALGAIEQRLIESRDLLLAAIEQQRADTPVETRFRSRPTGGPRVRGDGHKR